MTAIEQAIDLVRRYSEPGKTKNLDELEDIFTPDFIDHSADGTEQGLDKLKEFVLGVWRWLPDIEVTIDTIFANQAVNGDPWAGTLVTLRGTTTEHNQTIGMQEVWVFRSSVGKITERW